MACLRDPRGPSRGAVRPEVPASRHQPSPFPPPAPSPHLSAPAHALPITRSAPTSALPSLSFSFLLPRPAGERRELKMPVGSCTAVPSSAPQPRLAGVALTKSTVPRPPYTPTNPARREGAGQARIYTSPARQRRQRRHVGSLLPHPVRVRAAAPPPAGRASRKTGPAPRARPQTGSGADARVPRTPWSGVLVGPGVQPLAHHFRAFPCNFSVGCTFSSILLPKMKTKKY